MVSCFKPSVTSVKARLTKKIDRQLLFERRIQINENRILLIGMPNSGKSTVLKQLRAIHGKQPYREEERARHKRLVGRENIAKVLTKVYNSILEEPYASYMAEVWEDSGVQECYQRRREYRLPDSAKYFLGEIKRLVEPNYLPSDTDIAVVRTTKITELKFIYDGGAFRIIEVGGLHGNSRKWIHHFENINSLIFVTALSEYDEMSIGQSSKLQTRLEDSLKLCRTIVNYLRLTLTNMILFLNKKDELAEKILYSHLADYFPDYDGPPRDEVAAREFILKMFVDQNQDAEKIIYSHYTCSIDTMNIRFVFAAVKDTILQYNIHRFLHEFKLLVEPNYLPSDADIAAVRTTTTEITTTELEFEYYDQVFRIIEVGGLHDNSRKWIHHFENSDSMIFVASLSAYDEVSVGPSSKIQTKLEDSLKLFRTIVNYPWFILTNVILFLNKKDLLAEKILYSHLADYFPDYDGPPRDEVAAMEFILMEYVNQNQDAEKIIYSHFTCSIDIA